MNGNINKNKSILSLLEYPSLHYEIIYQPTLNKMMQLEMR